MNNLKIKFKKLIDSKFLIAYFVASFKGEQLSS